MGGVRVERVGPPPRGNPYSSGGTGTPQGMNRAERQNSVGERPEGARLASASLLTFGPYFRPYRWYRSGSYAHSARTFASQLVSRTEERWPRRTRPFSGAP